MIRTRQAGTLDARDMADLLNAIITKGGTTALTTPVTRDQITDWMTHDASQSAWHVTEDSQGRILGFQYIHPHPDLPPDACSIATFVRLGQTGLGIGSALFRATEPAARTLGYRWINATIRADNTGGLIYYQSRGFEDYHILRAVRLDNGQIVDKISKRYDL